MREELKKLRERVLKYDIPSKDKKIILSALVCGGEL